MAPVASRICCWAVATACSVVPGWQCCVLDAARNEVATEGVHDVAERTELLTEDDVAEAVELAAELLPALVASRICCWAVATATANACSVVRGDVSWNFEIG